MRTDSGSLNSPTLSALRNARLSALERRGATAIAQLVGEVLRAHRDVEPDAEHRPALLRAALDELADVQRRIRDSAFSSGQVAVISGCRSRSRTARW